MYIKTIIVAKINLAHHIYSQIYYYWYYYSLRIDISIQIYLFVK